MQRVRSHRAALTNVFLWFAAVAFLAVLFVFDSPAVDYRFVMLGGKVVKKP